MIPPHAETIRQYLLRRRISSWAIASRLGVDHSHLVRVLAGKRPGSKALLRSVAEMAESMDRPDRRLSDVHRLVGAATHVFFLKRGAFDSDIFTDTKGRG